MDRARDLYRRTAETIGPKKLAGALGLSWRHIYRLMADPMALDNADGPDGANRTEIDRLDIMWDLLSAHPDHRPLLIEWEQLIREGFDRRIRHIRPRALTHEDVVAVAAKCVKEHGDAISEAMTEGDDPLALHEASELLIAVQDLVAALSARVDAGSVTPIRRPA